MKTLLRMKTGLRMKSWLGMGIALGMIGGLAGCSEEKKDAPAPIRPVMWTTVVPQNNASIIFAGTIEPQLTANLGFQALGRIVSRDANIGDRVVIGQKLAALDAISAELALKIAESDLISAQAQETNAVSTAQRQESLLERKAVAQADVDIARQARDSAMASVLQAQANVDKAREQLGYTELKATFDGVVTAVSAEVGQTVSPGTPVLTVAEPNRRDAVVDIPDGLDEAFKLGTPFVVAMQANPSVLAKGTVREVAPDADPITRTRRIKIGLDYPPVNMRLGTTITATLAVSSKAAIYVPKTAILDKDGKSYVWVIDTGKSIVNARAVSLGGDGHDGVEVKSGLEAGMKVATAGVHTLEEGQSIKFDASQPDAGESQ